MPGRGSAIGASRLLLDRGLTPFIGRGEIIAAFLTDFLDGTQPATRRCALVVGRPGLGKTRLLEEVLGQCDEATVTLLRGSCESYLGAEVLQPFLQMLRALFGARTDMPKAEAATSARDALQSSLAELGPRAETILGLISAECRSARQPLRRRA